MAHTLTFKLSSGLVVSSSQLCGPAASLSASEQPTVTRSFKFSKPELGPARLEKEGPGGSVASVISAPAITRQYIDIMKPMASIGSFSHGPSVSTTVLGDLSNSRALAWRLLVNSALEPRAA